MKRLTVVLVLIVSQAWLSVAAHEVRPAYLGLNEVSENTFDVTWRQPVSNGRRLRLEPVLPKRCETVVPPTSIVAPESLRRSWQINCAVDAWTEQPITVEGLVSSQTDVWVEIKRLPGKKGFQTLLNASQPQHWVELHSEAALNRYFSLGLHHLLSGVDHILFLAGLLLIVRGLKRQVMTITAFTAAHSITLIATVLGWMSISPAPAEAAIALSVLFLAVEASRKDRHATLTAASPWLVAFIFGLLHGFGFSGALSDVGLPMEQAAEAMLLFNLGIEAGQLIVVSLISGFLFMVRRLTNNMPELLVRAPVFVLGSVSCYLLLTRLEAIAVR